MRSVTGMTIGFGGAVAIAAFATGVLVMRPAVLRAAALAQAAAKGPESERDAQLAAAMTLRMRAALAGRIVAALLVIAVVAMSIARYV
jgi:hypothetical protein